MSTTSGTSRQSIFRTKSIEASMAETEESEYKLKKRLSALDLTVFGIGYIYCQYFGADRKNAGNYLALLECLYQPGTSSPWPHPTIPVDRIYWPLVDG